MKNFSFVIACICILLFSCTPRHKEYKEAVVNINIDTLSATEAVSIQRIRYIPLETTDDCLMKNVDKIFYRNNQYYIFDSFANSVFIFDAQGKFINKIHAIGNGPGEYISAQDMDIDEKGNIWLYDLPTMRLLKYSYPDLRFTESYNINQQCLCMSVSDSEYMYLHDVHHRGEMDVCLGRYSISDGKYEDIIKNSDKVYLSSLSSSYFFRSGEILYYYKRYEPYIYRIVGSQITPYFNIISNHYPTQTLLEEHLRDKRSMRMFTENYVGEVTSCYETDSYIFINIMMLKSAHLVIDKQTNIVYRMKHNSKTCDFNNRMRTAGCSKDNFIGWHEPTEKNLEYILSQEGDVENKEKIKELTEEANPILLLYTFEIDSIN